MHLHFAPVRIAVLVAATLLAALPGQAPNQTPSDATKSGAQRVATNWTESLAQLIADARQRTLSRCKEKGLTLPTEFLAWIDADPVRQASVYGWRSNPLPVLLQLRSLEIDLGVDTVRYEYPQLALAFAIDTSFRAPRAQASGWNDGDYAAAASALPDISPRERLQLKIPGDPRIPVDTRATNRKLDRDDHIINFLEQHAPITVEVAAKELPPLEYDEKGVAKPRGKAVDVQRKVQRRIHACDVIASLALQKEFNAYMEAHGHPEAWLDCGERAVHWHSTAAIHDKAQRQGIAAAHELFHTAYRNKGRMPAARDVAPTAAESMAWFIRNDRDPVAQAVRKDHKWPQMPLNAPWPVLLMLAADDQPLREREEIWKSSCASGQLRTYGEYIGDIAQQGDMQAARRVQPFPFSYGSIQMMWKDGGVCGTMGNIGARTWRIVGMPASTAGQPGHCAMVRMDHDAATGRFSCRGEQYATGGDEVTHVHAGYHVDDAGGRRPMIFHQAIAWGVSHDVRGYVNALALRRWLAALTPEERGLRCAEVATAALAFNPFALVVLEACIAAAPDAATAQAIADETTAKIEKLPDAKKYALLSKTVRDLAQARAAR